MSLSTDVLQSLISRNRNEIFFSERYMEDFFTVGESDYFREKRKLAKLVVIQKALKAELRSAYTKERIGKAIQATMDAFAAEEFEEA